MINLRRLPLKKETHMTIKNHDPKGLYPKYPGYAHAVEVAGGARTLYISGLNGYEADGKTMPESFEGQSELIWRHIGAILSWPRPACESETSCSFEPALRARNTWK